MMTKVCPANYLPPFEMSCFQANVMHFRQNISPIETALSRMFSWASDLKLTFKTILWRNVQPMNIRPLEIGYKTNPSWWFIFTSSNDKLMPKGAFSNCFWSDREHLKAFPFHQMAGSTDYHTKSLSQRFLDTVHKWLEPWSTLSHKLILIGLNKP